MKVYGKNVLNEVLSNPQKIKKLYMTSNMKDERIMQSIRKNKIQFESVSRETMDRMVKGNHQGIMAIVDDFNYADYKSMYNEDLVVVLDHLEDPHNFGAIIRTCEAAGVKSIIIPKDRSVDVNETVMKTSTGALEYVNIARVNNLVKTINDFKDNKYNVLFASYSLVAEGLDIPQLEYLIMATPVKDERLVIQSVGRCQRPSEGKTLAKVYDLIDNVGMLDRFTAKRRSVYKKEGWEIVK